MTDSQSRSARPCRVLDPFPCAGLSRHEAVVGMYYNLVDEVPTAPPDGSNQWEQELDEWLDSFPQEPVLHEEAQTRELVSLPVVTPERIRILSGCQWHNEPVA